MSFGIAGSSFNRFGGGFGSIFNSYGGLNIPGYDDYQDISVAWRFTDDWSRQRENLMALYRNLWQCRRACDYFPNMMGRGWCSVALLEEQPDDNTREQLQHKIDLLRPVFVRSQKIANLYGGSIVIRYTDDSNDLREPLDPQKVTRIEYSRIFDRWEATPDFVSVQTNPQNPEYYSVIPRYYAENMTGTTVHSSRVLRYRGLELPDDMMIENNGWEDSYLVPFVEPLLRYLSAEKHVSASVKSFEFLTFLIENLLEKSKRGDGLESIHRELIEVQRNLSGFRGIALDKERADVKINSRRYNGITNILTFIRDEMIAASGLNKVQMYREHPEGFNATGESQRVEEANDILAKCQTQWNELLIYELHLWESILNPNYDEEFPNSSIKWETTYYSTPSEECDNKLKTAQTDNLNIANKIYSSEEARNSRYSSSTYSEEIVIS